MNRFSLTVGATLILASSAMAQGESDSLPKRQGYRNGSPVTKDTPPPNKKPPNVHEVRKAAGYVDKPKKNPPTEVGWGFCCTVSILGGLIVGIPVAWSIDQGRIDREEHERNLPLIRERIRNLEEKARKGDLVAFQQWKEATGRVGSKDMTYSYFMVWW